TVKKTPLDLFRLAMPFSREKKEQLELLGDALAGCLDDVKYLLKQGRIKIESCDYGVSAGMLSDSSFLRIIPLADDKEIISLVNGWNEKLLSDFKQKAFKEFSKHSKGLIEKHFAPEIVGMEHVKKAAILQLFSKERFHILLLGDPGTGKTGILRASEKYSPVSSFGLGSGTSSAGLTVSGAGDDMSKGLLAMAHNGICYLDELNLLKKEDRSSLLNAMEKGFVTFDKGGKHLRFDANARVLATANPKGDSFVGVIPETLRQQMPFDPALVSRFHLVFLVRKHTAEEFRQITKKIISDDKKEENKTSSAFIRDYVLFCEKQDVSFDKKHQDAIMDFIEKIKKDEKKFIVEIGPRLVIGLINIAKASARMQLKDKAEEADVKDAISIVEQSLYFRKEKNE
ncbi:MAG: ATP-binding protein, partial [Candidatus Woesearchaeota archaeon]